MSYRVQFGVGADQRFEYYDRPEQLTDRLAELGVAGKVTLLPPGNASESEEWVTTDYDPEWGDQMLVSWRWDSDECRGVTVPPNRADTCIRRLAAGWILLTDLCPGCTRRAMRALESLREPLDWHSQFTAKAQRRVMPATQKGKYSDVCPLGLADPPGSLCGLDIGHAGECWPLRWR